MASVYDKGVGCDGDHDSEERKQVCKYLETVSLLVSEGLHKYTFPTSNNVDPGTTSVWILKLIEEASRRPHNAVGADKTKSQPPKNEKRRNGILENLARVGVGGKKKTMGQSLDCESQTKDRALDGALNSSEEGGGCANSDKIDLTLKSKLEDFQNAYEWSFERAISSHASESPYIDNFWKETPAGPQPEKQKLFIFTGPSEYKFSPVVISTKDYAHMHAKITVVWTPFGRDYFVISGSYDFPMAARIALSLFLRYAREYKNYPPAGSLNLPPEDVHSLIFDDVFREARIFSEKDRSIVDILYEAEKSERQDYRTIDVIASLDAVPRAKFLFDNGVFGAPMASIRGNRSSSFLLMHLEAISAENQVYPRPSCDFSLSEEQYREEILKKSNNKGCHDDSYISQMIKEIVETEIRYVNRQSRLVAYFYHPAIMCIESTDFVKREYASRCMPSPGPVIDLSKRLLASFGISVDSYAKGDITLSGIPSLETLCNGFIEMFESDDPSSLEVYRACILNYEISKSFFSEASPKNEKFFTSRRNTYFCDHKERVSVESLRIEPIQRAGRYGVLLESIATTLNPSHKHFDLACRAAYLAKLFSSRLNYEDEVSLNAKANILLCHRLRLDIPIFDLQSWYIREIVVELLYSSCTLSNVSSKSDYTLVLFSSFLLVIHNSYMRWVHQHEGSLSPLRYSLNLSDIEVLDCSLNDFIIHHNENEFFRFRARSKHEKESFLKVLGRQTFFRKGQVRNRAPYDAYYQEIDGHDVYYRVMGIDAIKFEAANKEARGSVGVFLYTTLEDYAKNVCIDTAGLYGVVSVVNISQRNTVRSLLACKKKLEVLSRVKSNSCLQSTKVLNTEINLEDKCFSPEISMVQLSNDLKSAITNYVRLSKFLSFKTDGSWWDRRMYILMCNLACACGLSQNASRKAMSILTKKSRTSKVSIMTFTTNLKKCVSSVRNNFGQLRRNSAHIPLEVGATMPCFRPPVSNDTHPKFCEPSSPLFVSSRGESLHNRNSATSIVNDSSSTLFGDSNVLNSHEGVIYCVKTLIDIIESKDNACEKGLYRISSSRNVNESSYHNMLYSKSVESTMAEYKNTLDAHTAVSILKSLLKDFFLRNPIVSSKEELACFSSESGLSLEDKIARAREILGVFNIEQDPKVKVAELLLHHLFKVSENSTSNLMQSLNLASVLSPTLFCGLFSNFDDISVFTNALDFFIEHSALIYEKQSDDASNKILNEDKTLAPSTTDAEVHANVAFEKPDSEDDSKSCNVELVHIEAALPPSGLDKKGDPVSPASNAPPLPANDTPTSCTGTILEPEKYTAQETPEGHGNTVTPSAHGAGKTMPSSASVSEENSTVDIDEIISDESLCTRRFSLSTESSPLHSANSSNCTPGVICDLPKENGRPLTLDLSGDFDSLPLLCTPTAADISIQLNLPDIYDSCDTKGGGEQPNHCGRAEFLGTPVGAQFGNSLSLDTFQEQGSEDDGIRGATDRTLSAALNRGFNLLEVTPENSSQDLAVQDSEKRGIIPHCVLAPSISPDTSPQESDLPLL